MNHLVEIEWFCYETEDRRLLDSHAKELFTSVRPRKAGKAPPLKPDASELQTAAILPSSLDTAVSVPEFITCPFLKLSIFPGSISLLALPAPKCLPPGSPLQTMPIAKPH